MNITNKFDFSCNIHYQILSIYIPFLSFNPPLSNNNMIKIVCNIIINLDIMIFDTVKSEWFWTRLSSGMLIYQVTIMKCKVVYNYNTVK